MDRTGAHQRHHRRDRTARHRGAEVLFVVLRECRELGRERCAALLRPRLEAIQPFVDIGEETRLRLLAVAYDIDAGLGLPAHTVRHGGADPRLICGLVVRLAGQPCLHHVEHVVWSRQAADMRGKDPIHVLLAGHPLPPLTPCYPGENG